MATPTKNQAVSTPKNPLVSTPSRLNASSPRPGTSTVANRSLAHKSPAVKTPASAHGHSNRNSQHMSTPLAASTLPDDLLNLNSPGAAALILGQAGLTPLPVSQDGLGISTGITPTQTRDVAGTRDPQLERTRRLKDVAQTLRKRATGRNVTRDNLEVLAQVYGFDSLWDGDNLQLAGSRAVDLEIFFDGEERDKVVKSVLKLNLPDEEGQPQPDASRVLTENLTEDDIGTAGLPWRSLDPYASNLSYLDCMEHIDSPANCFHLIGGLYNTFQKIWDEEKIRHKWRNELHHQRQGNVGTPLKDAEGKLGLRSKYWAPGKKLYTHSQEAATIATKTQGDEWIAQFFCEKGAPSIPSRQSWLAEEALLNALTAENLFQDSEVDKPNWQDPTTMVEDGKTSDAMNLDDQPPQSMEMLDVRFACKLDPPVLLPMHVANSFNVQASIIDLEQSKVSTFQQALNKQSATQLFGDELNEGDNDVWKRTIHSFDKLGNYRERSHTYHFYTAGNAWTYSTSHLHFSHPQQFANALPILRQYALVETLLKSITPEQSVDPHRSEQNSKHVPDSNSSSPPKLPIKRSNKAAGQKELNLILRTKSTDHSSWPIDVHLDVASDLTKATIECRMPLPRELAASKARPFLSVTIEVRHNGLLQVMDMHGVDGDEKDRLSKRLKKVLQVSEDIGVAMEWLLEELRGIKTAA